MDVSCLHVVVSTKTPPLLLGGVREQNFVEIPNGANKRISKVYRKIQTRRSDDVVRPGFNGSTSIQDQDKKVGRSCGAFDSSERKKETKPLLKWGSYGGCLPVILRALDTIKDLDEALKPWEKTLNNKERSIILKEQVIWERALEIFNWFKRKGCYELNVIHYNIIIRILGKARKWDHVENLWNEMQANGTAPTNSTYGTLIDVYSKGGLREEALLWLERMNKQGMEPDEVTMGIVVQTYKKSGEFEKAENFFKKWSSGKPINGRGKIADINNTRSEPLVTFSSYTYNTLMDMYGKAGQLQDASDTFSRMLREGIVPTIVTFNTMIHICGNNGKFKRHMVGEAEDLILEMDELDFEIDEYTQSALTRMYIEAGMLQKSRVLAYGIGREYNKACETFDCMEKLGLLPDKCSYSSLIQILSGADLPHVAAPYVRKMQERGLVFDCIPYCAVISSFVKLGQLDMAEELFTEMIGFAVQPDKFVFGILINAFADVGSVEKAANYVNKMGNSGLCGNPVIYNSLIKLYTKVGFLQEAEETYKLLRSSEGPDVLLLKLSLGVVLVRFGASKDAVSKLEVTRRNNAEAGLQAWMKTLWSMICIDDDAWKLSCPYDLHSFIRNEARYEVG
ncbi:hypothetical protein IFM89_003927 [Coptis chinensis]|uniref:Pentatricopeptide repeat-containing protein n=1 Tax=Coptis chinensis TaxID=261450 RepID=A0A835LYJ1_9MAGN|nr:hypothetical protein IFM89_003927 [Coptis chinensis]